MTARELIEQFSVTQKLAIKIIMLDLIGSLEYRETSDMSLNGWTNEDYKAFGKNELKNEIREKVESL